MSSALVERPAGPRAPSRASDWAATRMWLGCSFGAWMRMLVRHRFRVHPSQWHTAAIVTPLSVMNSLLRVVQDVAYGEQLRRTPIPPPLFILGHWRSGTTLLHELLTLDPRHTYPTTYECFEPNHFLLTEAILPRLVNFLMPSRRPMDNMAVGWDRPQEDEFALCLLGLSSPFEKFAFPNDPEPAETLDLEALPPGERARWERTFLTFLRGLAVKDPRRPVLKSPTHSFRVRALLRLFPEARFVHIVRDPYVVFPSTVHLWTRMYRTQGLQVPRFEGLQEQVFETYLRLFAALERDRRLVPPGQFHELHYEDLVRDPVGQVRALYERLDLGGFDAVLPRLESYLAEHADYATNRYELTPAQRDEIARRWGPVIRRYGYAPSEAA